MRQGEEGVGMELITPGIEGFPRQRSLADQLDDETHAVQILRQVINRTAVKPCFLSNFTMSFFAACASRLRWTRKSSTSPSLSTARQSQYLPPRIEITISSRGQ